MIVVVLLLSLLAGIAFSCVFPILTALDTLREDRRNVLSVVGMLDEKGCSSEQILNVLSFYEVLEN